MPPPARRYGNRTPACALRPRHPRLKPFAWCKDDVLTAHHRSLAEAPHRPPFGCCPVVQMQSNRVPAWRRLARQAPLGLLGCRHFSSEIRGRITAGASASVILNCIILRLFALAQGVDGSLDKVTPRGRSERPVGCWVIRDWSSDRYRPAPSRSYTSTSRKCSPRLPPRRPAY